MARIELPYDRGEILTVEVPDRNLLACVQHPVLPAVKDAVGEIRRAMGAPVASASLAELAGAGRKTVIAVTDITRYCPDREVAELVLEELHRGGARVEDVTFVMATGTHRDMTRKEIAAKLGEKIAGRYRIVNHNWKDEGQIVDKGEGKHGFPIQINRLVAEADLRITTGVIEPHLFAGYSGGAKTILIGAGGHATIGATHGYATLSHPRSLLGDTESLFRQFINDAGERVCVDFVVNLVVDPRKRLLRAFAGRPKPTFEAGVTFARGAYEVPVPGAADIVISVPGFPKNLNLYQATRAANPAILARTPTLKPGGILIIPAPCRDGLGEESYSKWLADTTDGRSIVEKARTEGFPPGAHKGYLIGRYLTHASEVIITDCMIPEETICAVKLTPMKSLQSALDRALGQMGPDAKVLVIPAGTVTVPVIN